ncbi:MAG: hypothetical protein OXC64_04520 [Flavobacteriaceae bacterium]|nr:hypothetical protein [Flavobacteriaceae bacterium]
MIVRWPFMLMYLLLVAVWCALRLAKKDQSTIIVRSVSGVIRIDCPIGA